MTFQYNEETLADMAERKYRERKKKAKQGEAIDETEEIVLDYNNSRWLVGFNMMDIITNRVKYENMNEASAVPKTKGRWN